MDNETTEKSVNWEKHWFTEQQIMEAPVEEKIEKLMNLTSAEAVNAGFSRWLDEWLIDVLEENGVVVLEKEE
ncbi:hypothetical protein [Enterococcus plantarum]|uniref:hypothetical protein n=1 Tax=Enterococcus plantarum TaxID=1077675 RepID=UPI001A8FED7D|nr:hypothetical protein [Enterococcus plantarum]MBO0422706.1 hypothetical protein [Enterococcus plantarum]